MQALLVEILTEELPPKSLRQLSEGFAGRLLNDLDEWRLLNQQHELSIS